MTDMLDEFASYFHQDMHLEFAGSSDMMGDVLAKFDLVQTRVLRGDIINLMSLADRAMDAAFKRLGFEVEASSPAALRAFLRYIVDRIDGRTTTPMEQMR